jgi:hypothetical protein
MKTLRNIFIIVGVISACYFGYNAYVSYSFQKSMKDTLSSMNSTPFSCIDGSTPKIERWGFLGYSRYCEIRNLKDGPWEAWEGQYRNIKGSFSQGFQHGEWIWFNKDGSQSQQAQYSLGKELSKVSVDTKK